MSAQCQGSGTYGQDRRPAGERDDCRFCDARGVLVRVNGTLYAHTPADNSSRPRKRPASGPAVDLDAQASTNAAVAGAQAAASACVTVISLCVL